ncbi:MAG: transposase [Vampirovibrio sp.]
MFLTDAQREKIAPLLSGRADTVGVTAKDNRLFIDARLWRARSGASWRLLPSCFGSCNSVFKRFRRWCETDRWGIIFETLQEFKDFEYVMIDSTVIRAHQHATGVKGGKTSRHWDEVVADFPVNFMPVAMLLLIQSALFLPKGRRAIVRRRLIY